MRGSVDSRNHSDIFFWVVPPQADLRAEAGCVGATVTAPHRRVRCDDAAHDSRSSAPCRNTGRKNAREADSKTRSSHIGAEVKFRIALKISKHPHVRPPHAIARPDQLRRHPKKPPQAAPSATQAEQRADGRNFLRGRAGRVRSRGSLGKCVPPLHPGPSGAGRGTGSAKNDPTEGPYLPSASLLINLHPTPPLR